MVEIKNEPAMDTLLREYTKTINTYFQKVGEKMFEQKKAEIIRELEEKKAEMILTLVRDISRTYEIRKMGDSLTITINEVNLK